MSTIGGTMKSLENLSSSALITTLKNLNSDEVTTVINILLHLAEFNRRKLYAVEGYSSLFTYCIQELGYCTTTAIRRIAAARCVSEYPELITLLKDLKTNVTSISLIAKILTPANSKDIIQMIAGKSTRFVEEYVAGFLPIREIRETIKPISKSGAALSAELYALTSEAIEKQQLFRRQGAEDIKRELGIDASPQEDKKSFSSVPEVSFEVRLKASSDTVRKLRRLQALRGTKESIGDLLGVLLDEYLERHSPEARKERREKRRALRAEKLLNKQKKRNEAGGRSRHIATHVRDEIYERDGGRCSFTNGRGERCTCREHLQIDHIIPFAKGGTNAPNNLRLLCPAHNSLAADREFGREWMSGRRERAQESKMVPSTYIPGMQNVGVASFERALAELPGETSDGLDPALDLNVDTH
jgi:5-methylcytosine-specific restriction endonuclease McrA